MPNLKYHIETLGCRTNQADSATLCRLLEEQDFAFAAAADADLLIINTCTVTCSADQDSRQTIRKLRRENPRARLVVTGCYAQRAPQELAQIGGVDCVVVNAEQQSIAALAGGAEFHLGGGPSRAKNFESTRAPQLWRPAALVAGRTRPFVKIQDGCDAGCSYCIVPRVRGPARSAEPQQVLRQVRELIQVGHQEIVLTGIHLGSYGQKLAGKTSLEALVETILQLPSLGRLRLSGIEPMCFSRSLVTLAADNPKLAPHFHLPLQSGSARILRLMRRPYQPEQFSELVRGIASQLPSAAIGTDVIAGFPAETEAEHQETMRFLEESPLTHIHVFSYSRREGTAADLWEELPPKVVRRRSAELRQMAARKKARFEESFMGVKMRVLTLQPDRNSGFSRALTGNFIALQLPNVILEPNRWVDVIVEQRAAGNACGSLLQAVPNFL
jgi:threonylcarbamoyladenosine tRNA methylthiotransferase MtaB